MESTGYEHVVKKQSTPISTLKQVLLWVLVVLVCLALLWAGLALELFPVFLAIVIVLGFGAVLFMRRYAKVEYEYYIFEGTAVFSEILGSAVRRQRMSFDLRACERIAPLADEKWAEFAKDYPAAAVYSAVSHEDAPNIYFAAFTSEKGKKTLVFFEMTATALRLCRAANPQAVIMTTLQE